MITLELVKKHCRIDGDEENELLQSYLNAAIAYAELYQTKKYTIADNQEETEEKEIDEMKKTTVQAILMLTSHYYDNREGGEQGGRSDSKAEKIMNSVKGLLYFDRKVHI